MNTELRRTLLITNPWAADPAAGLEARRRLLPDALIPRRAAARLERSRVDRERAHLVVGPRQAGKSTLVWSTLGVEPAVLYLNCEEQAIRSWCSSPALFIDEASAFLPEGGTLFLEEAQWLEEAGLFIKGLIDHRPGWTVFVTGSSSFHLMSRTRESLAGRATRHHVWPLTLDEATHAHRGALPGVLREVRREALDRMMVWGSYPGVWTADDPEEVLHELVTAFVLRDASDRFRIERPDALRLILRLAAAQVGSLVRYTEWASLAGVSSPTVSQYVSLLEETHVLVTVRPFIGGRRAELTKAPKVYFVDGGLRNAVRGGFAPLEDRPDVGQLMEGWVFSELHKRWPGPGDVLYWRTRSGAEVDFVLRTPSDRPVGVEVKARRAAGRFKISRGARSFIEAYRPSEFLLVHRGERHEETVAETRVRWVPAEELPEVLDGLGGSSPR